MKELDLPQPGSNRGYSSEHSIASFWLGIWTGASRHIPVFRTQKTKICKQLNYIYL
jgi:hypothetical protein